MQRIRNTILQLLALTVVLALMSSTVGSAQAWIGKGRIQGKVTDPEGKDMEGVKVALLLNGAEGQGPEPLYTNKKGRWSYLGLTGGQWTVKLEYEGFVPSEGSVKVSEYGAGANAGSLVLRPIPKEVLEAAAADERRTRLGEGNDLLEAGKYAEARAAYEDVLAQIDESQHPVLMLGIARTHYLEDNSDKAIAVLKKSLEIAPDDLETLKLAVNLLVNSGREAEAQEYIARLPEGSKVDSDTILNLGINAYNENEIEKALEYFNRAAEENPDVATVYYYRGLAHLNSGNNDGAKADFAKMLELEPGHASAGEAQQFLEYLNSQE